MFKHTVEYVDFNGNDRKEDLYFHLAAHEVTRIEAEIGTGLEEHIQKLTVNQELSELLAFLEKIMLSSYGKKTSDGWSFYKTKEIRDAFEYSQAYAELFEQMVKDPELSRKFGESVAEKNGNPKKNTVTPKVITKPE